MWHTYSTPQSYCKWKEKEVNQLQTHTERENTYTHFDRKRSKTPTITLLVVLQLFAQEYLCVGDALKSIEPDRRVKVVCVTFANEF